MANKSTSKVRGKGKDFEDKKKRGGRRRVGDSKPVTNAKDKGAENDASWYTLNQALVADSGKIAFTWPTGKWYDLEFDPTHINAGTASSINGTFGTSNGMPGVMSLEYVPSYGLNHNGYDPLNIAAQNVYSFVRHANSGSANYDRTDLMLYLMAMDQIYTLYMHLVRAYGSIRLFSQLNRNFPKVILNAMGFNYDDISTNLANFRYYINNAATRIGAMAVPVDMPVFSRHMWMPSTVFRDSPSLKSQLYLFRPRTFGKYQEKASAHGGYLDVNDMAYVHTVAEWMQLLNDMIAAVRDSEDCGIISGDILKAYGDKVIKLPFISEDYLTNVVYSEEVLGQIANATVMPDWKYPAVTGFPTTPMIYQDINDNILKSDLEFTISGFSSAGSAAACTLLEGKRVMVGLSESPTPEEVMVNSRLMVIAKDMTYDSSTGTITCKADSVGTEVITKAAMYSTKYGEGFWTDTNPQMKDTFYKYYIGAHGASGGVQTDQGLAVANYFSHHPSFATYVYVASENRNYYSIQFDVDNFAVVGKHDLAKMHDTALLSMFDVPLMGSAK